MTSVTSKTHLSVTVISYPINSHINTITSTNHQVMSVQDVYFGLRFHTDYSWSNCTIYKNYSVVVITQTPRHPNSSYVTTKLYGTSRYMWMQINHAIIISSKLKRNDHEYVSRFCIMSSHVWKLELLNDTHVSLPWPEIASKVSLRISQLATV